MAFNDPYTPARTDWKADDLPGWSGRDVVTRRRVPAKRFLSDIFGGVVLVLALAAIWIGLAIFINAANGGV